MVYYESEGGPHNKSFSIAFNVNNNNEMHTYELTNLPPGGIHNIFLVAILHLPSPVVGPVAPSLLQMPGLLDMMITALVYCISLFQWCQCQEKGQEWLGPHTHSHAELLFPVEWSC